MRVTTVGKVIAAAFFGQCVGRGRLKTAFGKPFACVGGEGEQAADAHGAGFLEEVVEQHFAIAAVAGFGGDNEAGEFADFGVVESFEGDAAVDVAVVFEDGEAGDVVFEIFAAAVQQDALFFKRAYQGDDVRDVAAVGLADGDEGIAGDGGAAAFAGKEFAQQSAVFAPAEDLNAADAVFDGVDGGLEQAHRNVVCGFYQVADFA